MPGNKGGGRRKAAVVQACLESFADRIPILEQIADGKVVQRVKAGDNDRVMEPAEHDKTIDMVQTVK